MSRNLIAVLMTIMLIIFTPRTIATVVVVDFEALGPGNTMSQAPVDAYLASFGISISGVSTGYVGVFDDTLVYGGGVVDATGTQYLSHVPQPTPGGSFTLNFSTALDSFGFQAPGILVPSINPSWTAIAYDAALGIIDSVSFNPSATHATTSFLLSGPGITSITWTEIASSNAAFFGANLDQFVLTYTAIPEPTPLILLSLGLLGLGIGRRKRLQ